MKLVHLALLLVVLVAIAETMPARHWACHGGCNCQVGGEAGGHCHCPRDMPGVNCRWGGGHAICFPFWHGITEWQAKQRLGCPHAPDVHG